MQIVSEQSSDDIRRKIIRDVLASWRPRRAVFAAAWLLLGSGPGLLLPAHAEGLTTQQELAVQIYKELVEINTVSATGDTGRAADAMAARLRAAGFNGRTASRSASMFRRAKK